MALDSTKVRVAVSGEILFGLTTATAPASAVAVTTGFTGLGYVGEDGIEEEPDVSREPIKAWQNGKVVREVITDAKLMYKFPLIETTKDTVELYTGATVTQSATEGTYTYNVAATAGRKSFVLDIIDGALLKRIYVAEGEIFKGEGVKYAGGEAIGYACELVCYTDPVIHDTALKTP